MVANSAVDLRGRPSQPLIKGASSKERDVKGSDRNNGEGVHLPTD